MSCCDASSRSKQDPLPEGGREYRQRYTWNGSARSASLCIYIASRVVLLCVGTHVEKIMPNSSSGSCQPVRYSNLRVGWSVYAGSTCTDSAAVGVNRARECAIASTVYKVCVAVSRLLHTHTRTHTHTGEHLGNEELGRVNPNKSVPTIDDNGFGLYER